MSPVLHHTPAPRPQTPNLLHYSGTCSSFQDTVRANTDSEYKILTVLVLQAAIARQDNSHGHLSGQTVFPWSSLG